MQLTVLGRYSPVPAKGSATVSYLLQHDGHNILLDCGSGCLSKLPAGVELHNLDAVVLSHLHSDHTSDLFVLRYGIDSGLRDNKRDKPLTVFAPAEPQEEFRRLSYREAVKAVQVEPNTPLEMFGLRLSFVCTNHPILCYAMRITDGHHTLVYSADTGLSDQVTELAQDADLLLVDGALREADRHRNKAGHLTAREAAEMGQKSGAKLTLLTHLWYEYDLSGLLAEALAVQGDRVELAVEGHTYQV